MSFILFLVLSANTPVPHSNTVGSTKSAGSGINLDAGVLTCVRADGGLTGCISADGQPQTMGNGDKQFTGSVGVDGGLVVTNTIIAAAFLLLDGGSAGGSPITGGGQNQIVLWVDAGVVGGSPSFIFDAGTVTSVSFNSTYNGPGSVGDGGANFNCSGNPGISSPCFANFNNAMEIGGKYPIPSNAGAADVYIGAMQNRDGGYILSVLNNYGSPGGGAEFEAFRVGWQGNGLFQRDLFLGINGSDARITNQAGSLYLHAAGGPLIEWNDGAGQDVAQFYSGVGGTEVLDIHSDGSLKNYSTKMAGSITLSGGTGTATVNSGAHCVCVDTSATPLVLQCAVSSTTLTATQASGTHVISYICM